ITSFECVDHDNSQQVPVAKDIEIVNVTDHLSETPVGGKDHVVESRDVSLHGNVRAHEITSFECVDHDNSQQVPVAKDIEIVNVTDHLSETPVGGKDHVVESRVPTLE
nr:hypothetical protein [Tanacetum cinerariifolium]